MRMTSSTSSPMVSVPSRRPSTTTSRRNRPNAPEMSTRPPSRDQPVRPSRKARRYSTTWIRGSQLRGIRTSTTRPGHLEPLATRTTPPLATTRTGSSANGWPRQQRVRVEHRVGVHHATSGCGQVDAGVEGVRLAAVLLATTTGRAARATCAASTRRRRPGGRDRRHLDQVELRDQPVEVSSVEPSSTTTISSGVSQREHRLHRRDDAGALVVRRHDHRHPQGERAPGTCRRAPRRGARRRCLANSRARPAGSARGSYCSTGRRSRRRCPVGHPEQFADKDPGSLPDQDLGSRCRQGPRQAPAPPGRFARPPTTPACAATAHRTRRPAPAPRRPPHAWPARPPWGRAGVAHARPRAPTPVRPRRYHSNVPRTPARRTARPDHPAPGPASRPATGWAGHVLSARVSGSSADRVPSLPSVVAGRRSSRRPARYRSRSTAAHPVRHRTGGAEQAEHVQADRSGPGPCGWSSAGRRG